MSARGLVRRWWLIGTFIVLGAVAGLAYGLLRPPVYAAKAYVVVVAQNSGDSTAVSYAQAYARIAGQGEVLATAASASNGTATPAELRSAVRASSSPDAPIIEITGSGRPAGHSADLANLVANALTGTANRSSADTRVRLVLVSAAVAPVDPASPRPPLDVAVGAAAGLLLAGLAMLGRSGRTVAGGDQRYMPVETEAGPVDGTGTPDSRRWIGTAPALPRPRPAPDTGPRDGQPTSKDGDTGDDDDRTGKEDNAPRNGRNGRNGARKQQGQRVASRNVADRNTERRRGPR